MPRTKAQPGISLGRLLGRRLQISFTSYSVQLVKIRAPGALSIGVGIHKMGALSQLCNHV